MLCTHCGKEIPDAAKFCRYCGRSIQVMPVYPEEPNGLGPDAERWDTEAEYWDAEPVSPEEPEPGYWSSGPVTPEEPGDWSSGPATPAKTEPDLTRNVVIGLSALLIVIALVLGVTLTLMIRSKGHSEDIDSQVSEELEDSAQVLLEHTPQPSPTTTYPSISPPLQTESANANTAVASPSPTTTPSVPQATTTPTATATPKATTTPTATVAPKATAAPKATVAPKATTAPSSTFTPTSNTKVASQKYISGVDASAYLRTTPSDDTSSNILEEISLGTKVGYIEDAGNGYSKVEYNDTIGYIASLYLSDTLTVRASANDPYAQQINEILEKDPDAYGLRYDFDGNGVEELVLFYYEELRVYKTVAYTMDGDTVVPLLGEQELFYGAGGSANVYVGTAKYDGTTYLEFYLENSENAATWEKTDLTLYSIQGTALQEEHTATCFQTRDEVTGGPIVSTTVDGQTVTEEAYNAWCDNVEKVAGLEMSNSGKPVSGSESLAVPLYELAKDY